MPKVLTTLVLLTLIGAVLAVGLGVSYLDYRNRAADGIEDA